MDENIKAPVLDDIDYSASAKKGAPKGVTAPVLDDMDSPYIEKNARKGAPSGISAPVLDDMSSYTPKEKKSAPKYLNDEQIIEKFSAEQKQQFYILPDDKKKMVLDYTRKQLGVPLEPEPELKTPVLDEPDEIQTFEKPVHNLDYDEPLTAPVLDEAPETPEYVPKFANDDIEKIKQEAKKEAVKSQLEPNQKDQKESLRMMKELREQRERADAEKGFKLTIITAIIGCISAVLFSLFAGGKFMNLAYKAETGKLTDVVSQYSLYISIAVGICSFLLITGIKAFKSIATTIFMLFTIILIFPGIIMLTQKDGSMGINAVLYALSIIGSGYTFFSLTSNNKISLFFSKKY